MTVSNSITSICKGLSMISPFLSARSTSTCFQKWYRHERQGLTIGPIRHIKGIHLTTQPWEMRMCGKVCDLKISFRTYWLSSSCAVWHGKQLSYQKYGDLSARFVSEFGMHGFPIMRTTDLFFSDSDDRQPQSEAIDCHNKGHGAETRIARYLSENFRYDMKLENFVYCSQLLQSEAYSYALHDWKRKFKGSGREYCAGALIWQVRSQTNCKRDSDKLTDNCHSLMTSIRSQAGLSSIIFFGQSQPFTLSVDLALPFLSGLKDGLGHVAGMKTILQRL